MRRRTGIVPWIMGIAVVIALLTVVAREVRAETEVGVFGGHYSYHWKSESFTNSEHEMIVVRLDSFIVGRFLNSYKQPGFSGETYLLGLVHDWRVTDSLNQWGGHGIARGAAGINYGYQGWYSHDPDKSKQVLPFIAVGVYYRQPFQWQQREAYWEVGVLQFGDATVPSAGVGATF